MKELTDEQIYKIWYQTRGIGTVAFCGNFARAAIAADRALNAPADWDVMRQAPIPPVEQPIDRDSCEAATKDRLLTIIGSTYQILGALDAPAHILDVLIDPLGATDAQLEAMLPFETGPIGTNLLSADHAKEMLEHVLPTAPSAPAGQNSELGRPYREAGEGPEPTHEVLDADEVKKLRGMLATAMQDAKPPAEQQREQAPVAWMTPCGDVTRSKVFADEQSALSFGQQRPTPLYT